MSSKTNLLDEQGLVELARQDDSGSSEGRGFSDRTEATGERSQGRKYWRGLYCR